MYVYIKYGKIDILLKTAKDEFNFIILSVISNFQNNQRKCLRKASDNRYRTKRIENKKIKIKNK